MKCNCKDPNQSSVCPNCANSKFGTIRKSKQRFNIAGNGSPVLKSNIQPIPALSSMKNPFYLALALLILGSCKKLDDFAIQGKNVPGNHGTTVENLGHVFSGTNVTWKIHPLDPN